MADDPKDEGVYGENVEGGTVQPGIREETVQAHPQPTGDAAAEVRARGAEAIEGSEGSVAEDLDAVRRGAEQEAGSGGMGRAGTPRNDDGTPQGEFAPMEEGANSPG